MDHTLRIEDVLSPSHQRDGERARREAESPRAELPDWLAKELFKIFV